MTEDVRPKHWRGMFRVMAVRMPDNSVAYTLQRRPLVHRGRAWDASSISIIKQKNENETRYFRNLQEVIAYANALAIRIPLSTPAPTVVNIPEANED